MDDQHRLKEIGLDDLLFSAMFAMDSKEDLRRDLEYKSLRSSRPPAKSYNL